MLTRCLMLLAILAVNTGLIHSTDAPAKVPSVRPGNPFPFDSERKHTRDFRPSGELRKLSEHLYVFNDTCNVYIVKNGDRALLVSFGSGRVLEQLPKIGVRKVEQLLVTHHHRDQVQGLADLRDIPFRVTVPEKEIEYFEDVESFWRDVKLYINYNCRSHWNTLRSSIRVDDKVKAGDLIPWNGLRIKVLETPGATDHAVSYLAEIDGKRIVFCGNLISGSGKVPNWYDLHWDYYGFTQGMEASEASFSRINAEKHDRLLPAQGEPIDNPSEAMAANQRTYQVLKKMLVPNELHRVHEEVRQILPHLVYVGANCYAILSSSGKAFLWDYGYVDRGRVEELKERFNVTSVDAVSFSHYHDDHIIRTWELLHENAKIWIYENMQDIFENPFRYRLPCLIPFPIRADKVLHDGEKVQWQEYSLEFFHLPGQTEFHQGLSTTIDGKKVMFTGDNTWNKKDPEQIRNGPLVPHNEYFLDGGFISCAQIMLRYLPDMVCPAHTEEYFPAEQDLREFLAWAYRLREVMTALIDQPDPNFGMDVRWCHFYPYRSIVPSGSECTVELRVRNHLFIPARVEVQLKTPAGIVCATPLRTLTIEAKKQVVIPFVLKKGSNIGDARQVITADVTINGKRFGEIAEALVD